MSTFQLSLLLLHKQHEKHTSIHCGETTMGLRVRPSRRFHNSGAGEKGFAPVASLGLGPRTPR